MAKKQKVGVRQVLLGSVLLNDSVLKGLPAVLLMTLVGLVMITNRFKGEKIIRETVMVQDSIKILKLQSVTIEAELVSLSRFSRIQKECEELGLGLEKSEDPPIKIELKK